MTSEFKPGDRVYVTDPGLEAIRNVMRQATGTEPKPNHHGTVNEVWDDGSVLIYFDDGVGAPYPAAEVRRLEDSDHEFVPVAGHPDDDECTHRADGTNDTYCGRRRDEHE